MNNTDFRRILLEQGAAGGDSEPAPVSSSLGRSRQHVPLTPRAVKGQHLSDFYKPNAKDNVSGQAAKQFRSRATPKGSKLAVGYTDRARDRQDDESATTQDDREGRLRALEEQLKLGQIERQVFEDLRDEITGGDVAATHLVKGLDRRLLERVKKGEDVLGLGQDGDNHVGFMEPKKALQEEDELERLERQDLAPREREQTTKRGEMAARLVPVAGSKRSRNEILAELKASRQAAQNLEKSQLGTRFRKVGEKKHPTEKVERDEKGREVLITVDEDGRVKRKIRKTQDSHEQITSTHRLLLPDPSAQPLGMSVPLIHKAEAIIDDIFEDVGTDYDPLGDGGVEADSSDDEKSDKPITQGSGGSGGLIEELSESSLTAEPSESTRLSPHNSKKVDYFGDKAKDDESCKPGFDPLRDPTIAAALKRAAAIADDSADNTESKKSYSGAGHLLINSTRDRDLEDLDLGFGSSRFDDEEDEGDSSRRKLSEWKDVSVDGKPERGNRRGEGERRKPVDRERKKPGDGERRKPGKKGKQDKNSAANIFRVIEQRKTA